MSSITLSQRYGVNPSLEQCFYCMKDIGVILFGRIRREQADALDAAGLQTSGGDSAGGDAEAPKRVCMSKEPCDECKGYMEQGIILISVDESKSKDLQNPWRTGGWVVIKDEAIKRMGIQPPELEEQILKRRMAFLPDDAWDLLSLPRGESDGEVTSTEASR